MRHLAVACAAVVATAPMLAVSAAGALPSRTDTTSASADIDVSVRIVPGPPPVGGIPFSVDIGIGNAGPNSASSRLLVDLPEGLIATSPNPIGCPAGQGTLDCGRQDLGAGEDSDQFSRVRAGQPGTYTVVVRATELTATDPNPANNTASLTIVVRSPVPAVRAFAISPARPRAGARVRASFAIVESVTGKTLVPSAVRCTRSAAGAKVRGRGSVRFGGRATCTFSPPKSAKGSTLRGRISAAAAGKRLTRAFAIRLR